MSLDELSELSKSGDKKVRRRNRAVLSCQHCRQKKLKCDRNLPCSTCVKMNVEALCIYNIKNENGKEQESLEVTLVSLDEDIDQLKYKLKEFDDNQRFNPKPPKNRDELLIGINPVCSRKDIFTFQESGHEEMNTSKHFALLLPVFKIDPGFRLLRAAWANSASDSLNSLTGTINAITRISDDEILPLTKQYFGSKYISRPSKSSHLSENEVKRMLSGYGKLVGVVYNEFYEENQSITHSLQTLLPRKYVCDAYISIFFDRILPFFPVLDQHTFVKDLRDILEYSDDGDLVSVKLTTKHDLSALVIYLLVLRLAYLSIFKIDLKDNAPDLLFTEDELTIKFLLENPIPLEVISIVDKCSSQLGIIARQTLVVFQAFLLRRLYKDYASDLVEGPGIPSTQLAIGQLVQLGVSLNLNRDPDLFWNVEPMLESEKNLRRKLWHILVRLDKLYAFSFSYSKAINDCDWDTKLPVFSEQGANCYDIEMESKICHSFQMNHRLLTSALSIVENLTLFKGKAHVDTVVNELTQFENLLAYQLGLTDDYLSSDDKDEFLKIMKFEMFLRCKRYLIFAYQLLAQYHELRGPPRLQNFFHRKMLVIAYKELGPSLLQLTHKYKEYFESPFELVAGPNILALAVTISSVNAAFFIRLSATLRSYERETLYEQNLKMRGSFYEHVEAIKSLMSSLTKGLLLSWRLLEWMSFRYMMAWKAAKAQIIAFNMMRGPRIYDLAPEASSKAMLTLTTESLKDLEFFFTNEMSSPGADDFSLLNSSQNLRQLEKHESPDPRIFERIQSDNFWLHVFHRSNDLDAISPEFHKLLDPDREIEMNAFYSLDDIGLQDVLNFMPDLS